VLVIDDDRTFRLSVAELLRHDNYDVVVAESAQAGVEALQSGPVDLILLDFRMPGTDGMRVIEALRRWGEGVPILMITGFGSVETAVEALHLGADDFLTKPVDPDLLSSRVAELLERRPSRRVVNEVALKGVVGRSPAMQSVFEAIRTVAPTESTVLLTGETGTGKEVVARAIHGLSPRHAGPFVPVNCGSVAETLLESELFGHVRGAFTGAVKDRSGVFETASGGTILLDEVGDTSTSLQQRLLRVLQEREVVPVGAERTRHVDVRIVAATNRDLHELIAAGRFREDLYYRLNVFRIELPPLRERPGDIPLLVEEALARIRRVQHELARASCSPLAMRMLRSYDWPGNVRQLFAVIESSAIRAGGGRLEAQHLPAEVRERHPGGSEGREQRYRADDGTDERSAIESALAQADGVRARAADLLGMSRTTLWRKMKEYDLE